MSRARAGSWSVVVGRRDLRGLALAVAACLGAFAAPAGAGDSAVIFMYHRFGEGAYPTTNVRIEQFDEHIGELARGGYAVLPVPDILAAIRDGRPLPDRTVGLTIDDAFSSTWEVAWPRLRRAGLPVTLFVSTEVHDRAQQGYLTWDQIRSLRDQGVTIGAHTVTHLHMAANDNDRNAGELARSNERFVAELGARPAIFAYPYGEASLEVIELVRAAGYEFAFGQHSGVVHATADPFYLPRFALNENFGDLERFRLAARALPIPVRDMTPANPTLRANPPLFGFTVAGDVGPLPDLACYASGFGPLQLERLGPRVEARFERAFPPGRARINCTARAGERWRWFGTQFFVPGGPLD
ncbi:MAG: chitin deacetylase [Alphaproteobacteria bacterium]|nr:chitin deacetylase [Alphaproteobacteria bacterium]